MDNPPNANIHTIVKAQIVFLLSTLTEDNFERNQLEIRSLSEQHGLDTYLHFIRRLIVHSQGRLASAVSPSPFDPSSTLTFRLLVQETQRLAHKGEGDAFRHFDLLRFVDRVSLRPLERVRPTSSRKELASQATTLIRHDFENAVLSLCQHPSFDHADLSPQQVAKLMSNLLTDPTSEIPVLDANQRQALIVAAQAKYGPEIVAPILQRLFPNLSLPPGTSLVQTLIQLGPEISSDADTVRALLVRFGISDANPPRDNQVVEIMSSLARLAAEGATLCDVGALVRALSSFCIVSMSTSPWPNIMKLLIAILLNCPRDIEPHAVIGFWGTWKNSLYQLKLLDCVAISPWRHVQLLTVDDVATASPTIKSLAANVQGHTWNSLDLFEVLDSNWNDIRLEYSRKLLAMFLAGHPNHQLVFMRLWQIEPSYLTDAFPPLNITRILDVAQDLKILENLLEVRPFTFALDVAALASRREYLNLDKWLADNVASHGAEFLHSMIVFLEVKMESEKVSRVSDPPVDSRTMSLSPQTVAIFLRILRNNSAKMPGEDLDYCLEVRNSCLQIHPRLMNLTPGTDVEPGFTVISYSAEIESEVDAIYKQMYDEQTTIDDVTALLQRSKASADPRDHEIFSCMLHFLFDEYRFFQSYYPSRELTMTAYLFGSIIYHDLVDFIPLGIAIRYVVDALTSLARFESRLAEWQPLCQALLRIPHLMEARPRFDIYLFIAALASGIDGSRSAADMRGLSGGLAAEPTPVFNAIQPDKLEGEMAKPSEEVSDKILFIAKVSEMKGHFDDDFAWWFANYLVDQRISAEPNNHQLYLRFLDALDRQILSKLILHETLVKSAAVLNSEKTMQVTSERLILKNLGSWLGTITLARDKPIRNKNISFKDLLLEGYESGRLIVAIPFVCKTLEPCSKSKVFKPPSPLYHFADLKLNLKFEIEVFAIEATTVLRTRPTGDIAPATGLHEYINEMESVSMNGFDSAAVPGDSQVVSLVHAGSAESQRAMGSHIESILNTLTSSVIINPQLTPFHGNPSFKRAVQMAVDRAVREIILPVPGISTRELVGKDFATEVSEDRLRKAGHLMAQKLAGSLALVTCKDPLKSNLAGHIRNALLDHGFTEQVVSDQVLSVLVADNAEVAFSAIEKAAMERAVTDVDEIFATSYELRRRHRELRSGQAFWDPTAPMTGFSGVLPDLLRIKPTDFALDPKRRATMSRPTSSMTYSRQEHVPTVYAASPTPEQTLGQHAPMTHQEAMDRFTVAVRDLESLIVQLPIPSLSALPSNHDIRHLLRQVLYIAAESADRHRTPLLMSQKIVQLLYKTSSQLGREIYVTLLDQLCHAFEDVAKEAITWLLYAEDERKLNIPVTVTLLRSGLVNVSLQDQQLAKSLFQDSRPSLQTFAAGLVRECLSSEPPVVSQNQLTYTIEVLGQLVQTGKANEEVNRLLDDLRGVRRPSTSVAPEVPAVRQPSRKLFMWFQQWVSIFQRSHSSEKAFVPYITQLTKQGILKVEDVSSFFFRVCLEAGINSHLKCVSSGEFDHAFQALDALSRLIVYIIKYHGDASGVHYLTKILSIVVLVLANMHEEQGAVFQQKPFFRFFSSLVNDLHSMEVHLGTAYFHLLVAISDTFSSLQPMYFPGFAFSWLSLISHRHFMPKLLLTENREGWSAFHKLLLSLLKFLTPFLKEADLQLAARDLYRGTLRLLLVLLHDFPEFLSGYYFSLCDVIPYRCVQLRNIILSAFPLSIVLPDPHLRNVKFDSIPEMGRIPPILSDFASGLKSPELKSGLDQYLFNRGTPAFLVSLKERLKSSAASEGSSETYNLSLFGSVVMYIGVSSVAQAKSRSGSPVFNPTDPGVIALHYLATNLDIEGQHHLLSSLVLHLRYPNAHTHWFSSLLLHLFLEVKDDRFREVMSRVLLERFVVHRPHPWGALATFIELLRNSKYDFWTKEFIRVAPEVTMLLESIARSIY
ncbi:Not1-domain-containing protein [Pisolithus marmoratus]|nr:Not1-domain-containing protein [Pisolithus marmoratus]